MKKFFYLLLFFLGLSKVKAMDSDKDSLKVYNLKESDSSQFDFIQDEFKQKLEFSQILYKLDSNSKETETILSLLAESELKLLDKAGSYSKFSGLNKNKLIANRYRELFALKNNLKEEEIKSSLLQSKNLELIENNKKLFKNSILGWFFTTVLSSAFIYKCFNFNKS